MTMWPWRRAADTAEARECLDKLAEQHDEVMELGIHLREAQRRNHFSELVAEALARSRGA